MNSTIKTISLGASFAALFATAVAAGDMNYGNGGIKDYSRSAGAVPVPAPMPIQEAFTYYVRADVGYTAASSGTYGSTGSSFPVNSPSELDGPWVLSGAVGRQIGPNSRLEIALAVRNNQKVASGVTNYTQQRTVAGQVNTNIFTGATIQTYDTGSYNVSRNDEILTKHHDLMLNYYYDLKNFGGHVTPYVGAGVGIVMHQMARTAHEGATCASATNNVFPNAYPSGVCPTTLPASYTTDASQNRIGYGVAAAVMTGVAVELAPHVYWDTGYRLFWNSGKVATTTGTVLGTSTVSIGSTVGHEVRTGFRWDIW